MLKAARKDDYPFLADWFAIGLRWLVLLGAANALMISGTFSWAASAGMLVSAMWNLAISLLAVLNARLPRHRELNLLVDFFITALLFSLSGGLSGPLAWVGLLAIFSAAIYYEWRGSLVMAGALLVFQVVWTLLSGSGQVHLSMLWGLAGFNLFSAGLFGLLGYLLMRGIRTNYQAVVGKRKDSEQRMARSERERLRTFYRLVETLSATLNYKVVLESSLDLSISALGNAEGVEQMVGAILLFGDKGLNIGTARGFPASDLRLNFQAVNGILAEVTRSGLPRQVQKPSDDPELKPLLGLQNCTSALCLPLNRGLNSYGVMFFAHPSLRFFNSERCEMLEMISLQAVITIQNALLYQDLEQEKERILESQEEARKKLARDLHDGPTQSVAGIAMRINIARKLLETSPAEAAQELINVEDLARRTTQEIRTMLFTLRPLALETDGLDAAMQAMADKMRDTYQQNVVVTLDADVISKLETNKQSVIFYLAEEAVNNARKHAQASEIRVKLKTLPNDPGIALLDIADNGVGFNVKEMNQAYEKRGSLGMVNLRERADMINGVLHIDSAPGKGTRVQVAIPLTVEAADRLQRGLSKG